MSFADKSLVCCDCGSSFVHSAGAQEKFAGLGFQNEPKRCGPCRTAKKARGPGGVRPEQPRGGPPREMHTAVCGGCGGEARVPFKPRGDRPVYCSSCFENERK